MIVDTVKEKLEVYQAIVHGIKQYFDHNNDEILVSIDNSLRRFIDNIEMSVGGPEYTRAQQNFQDNASKIDN